MGALEEKDCTSCGATKTIDEFYTYRYVNAKGVELIQPRGQCMTCCNLDGFKRRNSDIKLAQAYG